MPEKNKKQIAYVSEHVGIAETILKRNGKTTFAVFKNGEVDLKKEITLPNGNTIIPLSEDDDVIKHRVISLPPRPISYVSEEELFNEIKLFIGKYFIINKGFREISALYVMLTWVYERFDDLPYLRVVGTLGTGKSRFLKTLGACTYNSMKFGSSSVAAMFRTIDQIKGTFILDEADFKNSEFSSDVAKILNNGNTKDMPVARMREGSKGELTTDFFQVFGPKILASRESFSDTALESRCFTQRLYPNKNIKAPTSLDDQFLDESRILRGKLLSFRFKNYWKMKIKELKSEKINNSRILQIAQPIWNIALLISEELAEKIISEALIMDEDLISDQADTIEADVLISIIQLLDLPTDKIHLKEIAQKYNKLFGHDSLTNGDGDYISSYEYKLNLNERKIGEIIGKVLHIKKHRDNKGFYIFKNRANREILNGLRNRYGITDDLLN